MDKVSQKILLLSGWKRIALSIFSGAITALALAPFKLIFVAFISFPILVWLLDGAVGKSGAGRIGRLMPSFWVGWGFGFGYFVAGLWWISNALLVEAPEFAWAIPLAVFGLPAVLAIFYGFATMVARALWSDGIARIFLLAAGFGLTEWLRSFVLTGFPWNAIAYIAMPSPIMMQSVAFTGFDAMNVLAVFLFALPASFFGTNGNKTFAVSLFGILLITHFSVGYWRLNILPDAAPEGRIVRIVQPSVDQSQKADPEFASRNFEDLLALTSAPPINENIKRPSLIFWPETAVPFILTREPSAVSAIADTLQIGQSLVAGVVREEEGTEATNRDARFYNSMLVIDSEGIISGAADKTHLVPFGEYLPLKEQLNALGLKAVAAADRGYVAASQRRSLNLPGAISALPLICYEVIFPNEIVRLSKDDAVIVNVTNDAWYGNSPGPYQHLHQSQLRTVELGLPMIRGANSGVSALIDAKGRIVESLPLNARGAFDAILPGKLEQPFGKTHESAIFWLLIVIFTTMGLISRARR